MVYDAAFALLRVLIQKGLGLFDAGQRQVARLDLIAVVLHDQQVEARGIKRADDDDGQQREAPKQSNEN